MKSIKVILLSFLLLAATTASAQYTQGNPKVEYMFFLNGYVNHDGYLPRTGV